ncbi:MAG: GGDEF domain-containing protein, partial [Rubrivivax sp.]|nr:GGDEF domain-containing protein [Rubrivivax sp.]
SQLGGLAAALQRALAEADDNRARLQAERTLKLSEMHCRRIFETSRDAVAILDSASGTVVEANRLMIELAGCRREELLGRKVGEVGPYKAVAVLGVVLRQLQQTDHVHYDHLALPLRNGQTVEVEVVGSAYRLASARFVQCTMRDITARRQAELELQRVCTELQAETAHRRKAQEGFEAGQQKASEESLRDSLTGLYNRRHLDQALVRAVSQAHRNRWLFSAMLIEVDHLKKCAEKHGHAAGELFMRTAGTHLSSAFRVADTVCRHGDETFAVLMPGTGPVAARDAAERLRARVHVLDLVLDGVALPALTLSIGVASLTKPGESAEALMQAADRALQRGKQAGRDQAKMYSDYVTLDTLPE